MYLGVAFHTRVISSITRICCFWIAIMTASAVFAINLPKCRTFTAMILGVTYHERGKKRFLLCKHLLRPWNRSVGIFPLVRAPRPGVCVCVCPLLFPPSPGYSGSAPDQLYRISCLGSASTQVCSIANQPESLTAGGETAARGLFECCVSCEDLAPPFEDASFCFFVWFDQVIK